MSVAITTETPNLGPISPNWTITQLLDWLAEDRRQHDESLRAPLVAIDAAMTGTEWRRAPSTVAVTRSIAATIRATPHLLAATIGELLSPPDTRATDAAPALAQVA